MPGTFRNRDLRIDLLRGLALWWIFADHIHGNVVHRFTYQQIGFSDALEIFVFLSGICCGLIYSPIVSDKGFLAAQTKATRRLLQLYGGYLVIAFATFLFVSRYRDALPADFLSQNDYDLVLDAPGTAYLAAAYLYYTPYLLKVLPLYMGLVAIVPVVVIGLQRRPAITLALSAAVWLLAALDSQFDTPNLVPAEHGFNLFSWQLLFCLGLWIGQAFYVKGAVFRPITWVSAACWVIVMASLFVRALEDVTRLSGHALSALDFIHHGKDDETVLRLAHFLAVAYLVARYFKPSAAILGTNWVRPLIWCGQHSLPVFCFGVLLSHVATLYLGMRHAGFVDQVVVNAVGMALMGVMAWSLTVRHKRRISDASPSPAMLSR
jgi:hypothetical protein